jgi:hypothetical protein
VILFLKLQYRVSAWFGTEPLAPRRKPGMTQPVVMNRQQSASRESSLKCSLVLPSNLCPCYVLTGIMVGGGRGMLINYTELPVQHYSPTTLFSLTSILWFLRSLHFASSGANIYRFCNSRYRVCKESFLQWKMRWDRRVGRIG